MNQLNPNELEAALIGHCKAKLPDITNIGALTTEDFNDDDQLVTDVDAIRFQFRGGPLTPKGSKALDYEAAFEWVVLVGARNLSTRDAERSDVLKLLSRSLDTLAGARLENLESYSQRPQVVLRSVALVQAGAYGTWFGITINVGAMTQYEANRAAA